MATLINGSTIITHHHAHSVELRFRVSASNGDYIQFPHEFTDDKVFVEVLSYYDGEYYVHCGQTRQGVTDRKGFRLSKLRQPIGGTTLELDTRADYVEVRVTGKSLVDVECPVLEVSSIVSTTA